MIHARRSTLDARPGTLLIPERREHADVPVEACRSITLKSQGSRSRAFSRVDSLEDVRGLENKTLIRIAALLVLAGFMGCAREKEQVPGETFDAGIVLAGSTQRVRKVFKIVNTSHDAISLLKENHSCSCTSIIFHPTRLNPGESTELDMSVLVPDGHVDVFASCTIATDNPTSPEWTYSLKFESLPLAWITPNPLNLGQLGTRSAAIATTASGRGVPEIWLELFAKAGEKTRKITSIDAPRDLDCQIDEKGERDLLRDGYRRTRHKISISSKGKPYRSGTFSGAISVGIDDRIPFATTVLWQEESPVVCVPGSLHFGILDAGLNSVSSKKQIVLKSRSHRAFSATSFRCEPNDVPLGLADGQPLPSAPMEEHSFLVEMKPPSDGKPRMLSGMLSVQTDHPESPEIKIPWSVFIRQSRRDESGEARSERVLMGGNLR